MHLKPLKLAHCKLTIQKRGERASLVTQIVRNLPAMQETQVQSLDREDPLEKEMATHSSIVAWEIPWTEAWRATVHGVTKSWTWLIMHIYIYIVSINSFLRSTAQPRDGKYGLYKVDQSKFKCQLSHLLDVWSGGRFYLTTFSFNFLICQTGVTITLTSEGLWGTPLVLSGIGKESVC